ncbi:hypothetical protein Pan97_36490 [Bremerella volcania]|uniref:Uncharacterized protein n=1 Tax=Bremerella volcania TaxID=2527984 RepID=A0A518CBJ7_9BACT|nr:hypothetical protein [Bremerella volcania]QDU76597.1 hypothetical protein Pan97_36490 [Bremerella volcania]
MSQRQALVQWSLLELVVVLTTGVVVIGSMWAPQIFLWLVLMGVMLFLFSLLAISRVGRGPWRAFATGFCCFAIGYFAALILVENNSFTLFSELRQLPTTNWMYHWQPVLTHTKYMKDGEAIPASLAPTMDIYGNVTDSEGNSLGSTMVGGGGGFIIGSGQNMVINAIQVVHTPSQETYFTLGHVFWALLLGYLGGKFAVGFQRFQENQETSQQPIE